MKKIIINLGLIINVVFLGGVLAVAYQFSSDTIFLWKNDKQSHFVVLVVFVIGFLAILLNYIKNSLSEEREVIFIDRISDSLEKVQASNGLDAVVLTNDFSKEISAFKKVVLGSNRNNTEVMEKALALICNTLNAGQGIIFKAKAGVLELFVSYAYVNQSDTILTFKVGEGLVGMVAKEKKKLLVEDVPDGYITIFSGLGKSSPRYLSIFPIFDTHKGVVGAIELAFFKEPSAEEKRFLDLCVGLLGADVVEEDVISDSVIVEAVTEAGTEIKAEGDNNEDTNTEIR